MPIRPREAARRAAFGALALALLTVTPFPAAAQAGAVADSLDTPIHPGDVLHLTVWREPDWSGDFLVDQFGIVPLPLVGEVDVRGQTQRSVTEMLRTAFATELQDASFQVLVLKRIRVVGEVKNPGVYTLDPTQSVADALAIAGGRSPAGRPDRVSLRRGGETLTTDVLQDARLGALRAETGDEISVPERSWLSRNSAALVGSAAGLVGLLVALAVR